MCMCLCTWKVSYTLGVLCVVIPTFDQFFHIRWNRTCASLVPLQISSHEQPTFNEEIFPTIHKSLANRVREDIFTSFSTSKRWWCNHKIPKNKWKKIEENQSRIRLFFPIFKINECKFSTPIYQLKRSIINWGNIKFSSNQSNFRHTGKITTKSLAI